MNCIRHYYLLSPLLQGAHGLFVLVVVGIVFVVSIVVVVSIFVVVSIVVRSSRRKGEGVVTSGGGETVAGEC